MNIIKRGKTFRITVSLGSDSKGNRIRETYTYNPNPKMTPKQAEQAAYKYGLELENKLKRGGTVRHENLTFNQFAEIYFKNHSPTLKEYTAAQYRVIYDTRIKPYFGNMRIRNITALDVRKWLTDLERTDSKATLSENTKGVYFRTLSAMLGVAVKWDILEDNPCRKVTTPKSKQSSVKALQQKDFDKLFDKLDSYRDPRVVLLIYLIALTGIRESEAAGLKWQDIDFENKSISIKREAMYIPKVGIRITTPKSATSTREIFVPDILIDKLKSYKAIQDEEIAIKDIMYEDEGFIITQFDGTPVHPSTIRNWIKKAFEYCDVPYITVHGLRHTYASLLIANGIDVRTTAAQLGHSSPVLTMNTYANPQNDAKRRAGELIGNIAKGNRKN